MELEFLQHFPRRMKSVGMYSTLVKNSWQKTTWKQYDFETMDEQLNLIYAVLLYVMEQSLKEEPCTIDDISTYVDLVCNQYLGKRMTYEMSEQLADFVVNVVLGDEGRAMYFDCFDFDKKEYEKVHVSYLANEIVYLEDEEKRTSYKLTDNGYNLILSTLEIENNMKLTIHEIIFKMHLDRASYDQALEEVKSIFNLLRIQLQKIEEAMNRIRRNALNYSVTEYEKIMQENLSAMEHTREKFLEYRQVVRERAGEIEEEHINLGQLDEEELQKLKNLQKIEHCLSRAIDEHQRILHHHFDLKELYAKELEQMSQVALIKRFSLRSKLYDQVIEHPGTLVNLEYFLRPLFCNRLPKVYNLNRCLQRQKIRHQEENGEDEELLDFDSEAYQREKERQAREKLEKYRKSLSFLLERIREKGEFKLSELEILSEEQREILMPSVGIFKEIMVEFLKTKRLDILALKEEKTRIVEEEHLNFELSEMTLQIVGEMNWREVAVLEAQRAPGNHVAVFDQVMEEDGSRRQIRCSDVIFRYEKEDKSL